MGLDNIPKTYPCKTGNTAVMVQRKAYGSEELLLEDDGSPMLAIDCAATASCGGCPYKNAHVAAGEPGGAVHGMFGTDCWYRGKYGNYLLEALGGTGLDDEDTFYGDNYDGTEKSAGSCVSLANMLDSLLEDRIAEGGPFVLDGGDDGAEQVRYASWWLRWVAEASDGATCWY